MAIEEIEVGQEPEINLFEGPIAGQSMAASPENKMPWDGPPKFSSVREASEAIFLDILEDDNLKAIVTMLQDDVPVSEITQVLLMTGFSKGQYNPDLLMLLIEPVMYMIMAIADKFGIADVKIYTGEEEDYDEDFDEDYTAEDDKKETETQLQRLFNNKSRWSLFNLKADITSRMPKAASKIFGSVGKVAGPFATGSMIAEALGADTWGEKITGGVVGLAAAKKFWPKVVQIVKSPQGKKWLVKKVGAQAAKKIGTSVVAGGGWFSLITGLAGTGLAAYDIYNAIKNFKAEDLEE